jgi:hypothetical protein
VNQRWNTGRDSYRPAGEPIRTTDYEVSEIAGDTAAKAFVLAHHYSGSLPATRWRFGLYRAGDLVGVAVFSVPTNPKALRPLPGDADSSTELGRFVLLDDVPGNGETWFLGRCFEALRHKGLTGVVSFSDPVERTSASGARVFPGHVGTIYQAHNAVYLGRATARTLHLLPNGTVLSPRSLQKIRAQERGWRYAIEQLVTAGAPAPVLSDDLRPWLGRALAAVTRTIRHGGNHKYVWALDRRARRGLPASLPYPKFARPAA